MAMAPMAAPAAAPMMDMPIDDTEAPAAPSVLMTIMDNHDGTITLVMGDEPEEPMAEEMAETPMAPPLPGGPALAVPGAPPPPAGAAPGLPPPMPEEEMEPVGDVFDEQSLGEMLKTIMDTCTDAMGGQTAGSEEADMMAQFTGAPV